MGRRRTPRDGRAPRAATPTTLSRSARSGRPPLPGPPAPGRALPAAVLRRRDGRGGARGARPCGGSRGHRQGAGKGLGRAVLRTMRWLVAGAFAPFRFLLMRALCDVSTGPGGGGVAALGAAWRVREVYGLRVEDRKRVRHFSQRCVEFPSFRSDGRDVPHQQCRWASGMCQRRVRPADAPSGANKIRQRRSTVQPFVAPSPARLVLLSFEGTAVRRMCGSESAPARMVECRHGELKPRWPTGRAGSSPAPGTTPLVRSDLEIRPVARAHPNPHDAAWRRRPRAPPFATRRRPGRTSRRGALPPRATGRPTRPSGFLGAARALCRASPAASWECPARGRAPREGRGATGPPFWGFAGFPELS